MQKKLTFLAVAVIVLALSSNVHAANSSMFNVQAQPVYQVGSESDFSIIFGDVSTTFGLNGIVTFSNTSASDIQSAQALVDGQWVNLSLVQSAPVSLSNAAVSIASGASYYLPSLYSNAQQLRVYFNNTKPTSITVAYYDLDSVFTAASMESTVPISVQSGQVLGASTINLTRNLRYGSTGADVTALQEVLANLNLFHVAPTGFYGSITTAAVRAFQKMNNIQQTGTVGPLTRNALANLR